MLSFNISNCDAAEKLIHMCRKFKGKMEIDVICGRYTIDAYSALGVYSLTGHVVSLDPLTDDPKLKHQFEEELKKLNEPRVQGICY